MHRASHDLPIFGKDGLNVALGHHGSVEVADEDARVEGARVILVGHVAGLVLPCHPSPAALPAGRHDIQRDPQVKLWRVNTQEDKHWRE